MRGNMGSIREKERKKEVLLSLIRDGMTTGQVFKLARKFKLYQTKRGMKYALAELEREGKLRGERVCRGCYGHTTIWHPLVTISPKAVEEKGEEKEKGEEMKGEREKKGEEPTEEKIINLIRLYPWRKTSFYCLNFPNSTKAKEVIRTLKEKGIVIGVEDGRCVRLVLPSMANNFHL